MSFEAFIDSLELRHFIASELLIGLDRGNDHPPEYLWPNIALTVTILDRVRAHFRRPITITSAYRSERYNRSVGGSRRSQHQAFTALDFKVSRVDPAEVARILKRWRSEVTLFRLPVRVVRIPYMLDAGDFVPFAEVETWDRRDELGSMHRFAGGIGIYPTFVHLDTRGLNHSWRVS